MVLKKFPPGVKEVIGILISGIILYISVRCTIDNFPSSKREKSLSREHKSAYTLLCKHEEYTQTTQNRKENSEKPSVQMVCAPVPIIDRVLDPNLTPEQKKQLPIALILLIWISGIFFNKFISASSKRLIEWCKK